MAAWPSATVSTSYCSDNSRARYWRMSELSSATRTRGRTVACDTGGQGTGSNSSCTEDISSAAAVESGSHRRASSTNDFAPTAVEDKLRGTTHLAGREVILSKGNADDERGTSSQGAFGSYGAAVQLHQLMY